MLRSPDCSDCLGVEQVDENYQFTVGASCHKCIMYFVGREIGIEYLKMSILHRAQDGRKRPRIYEYDGKLREVGKA